MTKIGVIACGGFEGKYSKNYGRKACVRLTNRNTWETFPSLNKDRLDFDMIAMGDVLVAIEKGDDTFEMINLRNRKKWETIQMDRKFYSSCFTKWDDENIIATGGEKKFPMDGKGFAWVSCTNINIFQFSFSNVSF